MRGLKTQSTIHTDSNPLLTGPEVAARLGISPVTWRSYRHSLHAPDPDDPDDDRPPNQRRPRWRIDTIDKWQEERRTQGWRKGLTGEQK